MEKNFSAKTPRREGGRLPGMLVALILCACIAAFGEAAVRPVSAMPVGVDDAGAPRRVWEDPAASQAYQEIGFDFLSTHFWPNTAYEDFRALDAWAVEADASYVLNQENAGRTQGDLDVFPNAGTFYQPDPEVLTAVWESPRFLGIVYDELAHCVLDGGWPTIHNGEYAPYFFDAKGHTLLDAYEGNLRNADTLLRRMYPGFAAHGREGGHGPIIGGEYVFPVLNHLFARVGIVPIPKYLKESVTPVQAAVAMGAAKQYGLQYWACLDLWHHQYPGHSPDALYSSLLFAYWTGAHRAYVENLNYNDSLYRKTADGIVLSPWGEAVREFRREYLPNHPRAIAFKDFAPEIIIIRFPDSDWGQEKTGTWITGWLYGAPGLESDRETAYWIRIWHVLTHGVLPPIALNYNNQRLREPFRFFYPSNNVAVYDHRASDPALFTHARLVFVTGKRVEPECLAMLESLVRERGLTVVTPSHLASPGLPRPADAPYAEHADGAGQWIVTDEVDHPEVVDLLQPFLGEPDEMRYVFGDMEVVFHVQGDAGRLAVRVRDVPKPEP